MAGSIDSTAVVRMGLQGAIVAKEALEFLRMRNKMLARLHLRAIKEAMAELEKTVESLPD